MPKKAIYLRFERDGEYAFEFFLAEKLGMTVADIRARMSSAEFVGWSIYYARQAQRRQIGR